MTTTPLSPKRLAEIAKLRDNAIGYHQRAMADLIDEVARLQSAVDRLANAERDLAETQLVLEQQDRDLERLTVEVAHWREARRVAVEAGEVLTRQRDEALMEAKTWFDAGCKAIDEMGESESRAARDKDARIATLEKQVERLVAIVTATDTAESVAETLDHIAAARARIDELETGPDWAELRRLRKLAEAAARAHDARDQIDESVAARITALEAGLREACDAMDGLMADSHRGVVLSKESSPFVDRLRALADGVQSSKETT